MKKNLTFWDCRSIALYYVIYPVFNWYISHGFWFIIHIQKYCYVVHGSQGLGILETENILDTSCDWKPRRCSMFQACLAFSFLLLLVLIRTWVCREWKVRICVCCCNPRDEKGCVVGYLPDRLSIGVHLCKYIWW